MSVSPRHVEEEEEEWEFVSAHEWQGQASFDAISWEYPDKQQGPSLGSRSRCYHHSLSRSSTRLQLWSDPRGRHGLGEDLSAEPPGGEVSLNPDHIGVRSAEQAVEPYEANVGFHFIIDPTEQHPRAEDARPMRKDIDESELNLGKERWDAVAKELVGNVIRDVSCSTEHRGESGWLHSSSSTPARDSVDLTDSEISVASEVLPVTPKAGSSSYANSIVRAESPVSTANHQKTSPSRSLNASASSFIPTPTPVRKSRPSPPVSRSPSPSFTNFSFPSLSSSCQSLPPTLKKDENGFYTEVTPPAIRSNSHTTTPSPSRASPSNRAAVPSFLAASPRKPSRTRAIVDKLRSASVQGLKESKRKTNSKSSSFDKLDLDFLAQGANPESRAPGEKLEVDSHSSLSTPSALDADDGEEDGWVRSSMDARAKARRTRDLVLALEGRGRPESSGEKEMRGAHDGIQTFVPAKNRSATDEGWIQSFPEHRGRHTRTTSSVSSGSLSVARSQPPGTFYSTVPPPPPPYFPPLHPAYATAYMQMQMQMQARGQWYPSPYQAYPFPPPHFLQPLPAQAAPVVNGHQRGMSLPVVSERGNITGASGMRHLPWGIP